eukprot:scaffold1940_cov112-Isochrysis_galbana.AAC.7
MLFATAWYCSTAMRPTCASSHIPSSRHLREADVAGKPGTDPLRYHPHQHTPAVTHDSFPATPARAAPRAHTRAAAPSPHQAPHPSNCRSVAGRFSILVMCMDKADARHAADAFDALEGFASVGALAGVTTDQVLSLRAKYE